MNGVSKLTTTEDVALITFNAIPANYRLIADIFNRFSHSGINIDMISQSPVQGDRLSVSFTVFSDDMVKTFETCKRIRDAHPDVKPIVQSGNCKIQLYGEEMRNMHGVAARAIDVIAGTDSEIHLITTSEVDISILLSHSALPDAVEALENAFAIKADCM